MIAGRFTIQAFQHATLDAKSPSGSEVKVLAFKDVHGGAEFHFVFSPEEFDNFLQESAKRTLVIAHKLPTE